jgi:hypothetical protein
MGGMFFSFHLSLLGIHTNFINRDAAWVYNWLWFWNDPSLWPCTCFMVTVATCISDIVGQFLV